MTEANEMTRLDRKTRYVLERGDEFDIFSTEEIRNMKRRGYFKRGVTIVDIYAKACYTATYNKDIAVNWRKVRQDAVNKLSKPDGTD